jgi:RNA polymerase sigma-70 factor, ECF subfamily
MWVVLRESVGVTASAFPMVDSSPKVIARPAVAFAGAVESAQHLDAAMERYARGEDAAFDELYRRAAPRLRGFLLRLSGNAALADDLAQEAFLRVHRARGSFEQGAAALPWIFAIARNVFLDHTRQAHVRRSAGDSKEAAAALEEREAPADTKGDEALVAREMADIVRATLERLPVLQREAFVLLRFEGLSVSEAAQVLGTTEGAVKVRAFRAYEALRAALGQDDSRAGGRR